MARDLIRMTTDTHGYEYISISWAGTSASGKTDLYTVTNNHSGGVLGRIKWHGPWRRYVFLPADHTLYSPGCLMDIMEFLDGIYKAHFEDELDKMLKGPV